MLTRATTMPIALRDVLALTKPRLSALVIVTYSGGMFLAPGRVSALRALMGLVCTTMVVGAANALNSYLERHLDRLMRRTRNRPLPARRLDARVALGLALVLTVIAVPALTVVVNPLTALLSVIALTSYVLVYTPMKQKSPAALWVGAIPGAIPPLMGWTAVQGRIELPGLVLFGILFCWQIPHFIAIAVVGRDDYARAGHKVLPLVWGERAAKLHAAAWAALLIPASLLLYPLGVAGIPYAITAAVLGVVLLGTCLAGWTHPVGDSRWATTVFRFSLLYLTVLFVALSLGAK